MIDTEQNMPSDPAARIKQFVDTVYGSEEYDKLSAVDYDPRDNPDFVCIEWTPNEEGRTQITHLQHKVSGVDKRFQGVEVDYANVARGYVKFDVES